jgi:hypothetical protein
MYARTFAAVLALAALPVAAADPAPAPSKEADELDCLVGSWAVAGTIAIEGKKNDVKGTYECKHAAGGFGVACAMRVTGIAGMSEYLLQDIWGYEPSSGAYHWYVVTNGGEVHDHVGRIEGAQKERAVLAYTGMMDGKSFREDVVFDWANEKKFVVTAKSALGGAPIEDTKLTFTKR